MQDQEEGEGGVVEEVIEEGGVDEGAEEGGEEVRMRREALKPLNSCIPTCKCFSFVKVITGVIPLVAEGIIRVMVLPSMATKRGTVHMVEEEVSGRGGHAEEEERDLEDTRSLERLIQVERSALTCETIIIYIYVDGRHLTLFLYIFHKLSIYL